MPNLVFKPEWISFTTRNLISWAKPNDFNKCIFTNMLMVGQTYIGFSLMHLIIMLGQYPISVF
jgi:hypothetical protein